jgi:hypothetical protein
MFGGDGCAQDGCRVTGHVHEGGDHASEVVVAIQDRLKAASAVTAAGGLDQTGGTQLAQGVLDSGSGGQAGGDLRGGQRLGCGPQHG